MKLGDYLENKWGLYSRLK